MTVTVACTGLDGCNATAVSQTPYVKGMRAGCGWGYAYPFDDSVGGFSCRGASLLAMTVDDNSPHVS